MGWVTPVVAWTLTFILNYQIEGLLVAQLSFFRNPTLKQGVTVLADQALVSLATFLTGVLVARSSSEEDYALYVLAISIALILQNTHRALVNLPVTIYLPRMDSDRKQMFLGSMFSLTVGLCLFIIALLVTINVAYGSSTGEQLTLYHLFSLLGFLTGFQIIRDFLRNTLLVKLNVNTSVMANIVSSTFLLSVMTALYVDKTLTVEKALLTVIFASTIACTLMFRTVYTQWLIRPSVWLSDFLSCWPVSKWATISTGLSMASGPLAYVWLTLFLLDKTSVAVFGACYALSSAFSPILRGGAAYVLPRMTHAYKDGDTDSVTRILRKSMLFMGAPFVAWLLFALFFSETAVTTVYSDRYSGYGVIFILLVAKTTLDSIITPVNAALQTLEKTRVIASSLTVSAIVTIVVGVPLIVIFGLIGGAITFLLSTLAILIWNLTSYYRAVRQI